MRAGVRSTRIIAATAASALLAGLVPTGATAASYPEKIAKRLDNVVYVEKGATPRVSERDAGRIRLRILDKDLGRIRIAVVTIANAEENGGVTGLTHAIARHLDLRGALLVVAGLNAYSITSHPESNANVQALQEAFKRHEGDRPRQLLAAVDAMAAIDPGPKADPQNPIPGSPIPNFPNVEDDVDGIFDAFRIGALITAIAVALPFVVLAIWLLLRFRRSRKQAEEVQEDRQVDVRDQLIKLGDEIRALDLDAQMPGVTTSSLADYEAAIEQYDRANATLERPDEELSPHRLQAAGAAVAEGMRRIEAAKVRLGRSPAGPAG